MEENISEYLTHTDDKAIKGKKNKIKIHHVIICLIIVLITTFLFVNIIWIVHRATFNKYLNDYLVKESESQNEKFDVYTYEDTACENKPLYSVSVPKYLCFAGNLYCGDAYSFDKSGNIKGDYHYGIMIIPHVFSESEYQVDIQDLNSENGIIYSFWVNKNLEIIDVSLYDDEMIKLYSENLNNVRYRFDQMKEFWKDQ